MSIEIFTDAKFSGSPSGSIGHNSAWIGDFWNDKISSIKVYSGIWEFFEHANFQGRSFRLAPGEYAWVGDVWNDMISSFKQVGGSEPPTSSNNSVLQRVLDLTNMERSKAGLPPLTFNPQLAAAAQKHSQDMALRDFYGHNSPDGRTLGDRVKEAGYPFSFVGENIYASPATPEEAVAGWMKSEGHRRNILNRDYKEIGVGYYFLANDTGNVNWKHYWTQVFGAQR